jgi:hypothetical protein
MPEPEANPTSNPCAIINKETNKLKLNEQQKNEIGKLPRHTISTTNGH